MTRIRNASKDTNFRTATSLLSEICSSLYLLNKGEHEAYEDIDAWHAPSECFTLVRKNTQKMREDLLKQYGVTEEQLFDLISARTSDRWIYYQSGLTW